MDPVRPSPSLRLIPGGAAAPPVEAPLAEQAVLAVVETSGGLPRRMLPVLASAWMATRHPGAALAPAAEVRRALRHLAASGRVTVSGPFVLPADPPERRAASGVRSGQQSI